MQTHSTASTHADREPAHTSGRKTTRAVPAPQSMHLLPWVVQHHHLLQMVSSVITKHDTKSPRFHGQLSCPEEGTVIPLPGWNTIKYLNERFSSRSALPSSCRRLQSGKAISSHYRDNLRMRYSSSEAAEWRSFGTWHATIGYVCLFSEMRGRHCEAFKARHPCEAITTHRLKKALSTLLREIS